MNESLAYARAWRRYRIWARLRLLAFLGFIPFGALISGVTKSPILPGAWFLFIGVTVVGAGNFRCPRCNKRFFYTWVLRNPFAMHCLHCGLPKWATHDPEVLGKGLTGLAG